jgi:hypothetical protein
MFANRRNPVVRPWIVARDTPAVDGLAVTLTCEDAAEERGSLSPHARATCPFHRRWLHQCVASPAHAIPVSGHRWCRSCNRPVDVAVDELDGTVSLTCPRCRRFPDTTANRELVRSCEASLAAARPARRRLTPLQPAA